MTPVDKPTGFSVTSTIISPTVSTEGAKPPQGGFCFFFSWLP